MWSLFTLMVVVCLHALMWAAVTALGGLLLGKPVDIGF